jgi:hypothetical protein
MSRIRIQEPGVLFGRDFARANSLSDAIPPVIAVPPVPPPPPGPTVPTAPRNVVAGSGALSLSANVSWTVPLSSGGSGILSYTVSSTPAVTPVTVNAPLTQATIPGLTNGQTYVFRVLATNAVGNSPNSAASNEFTPNELPEAALWFDPSQPETMTFVGNEFEQVLTIQDLTSNDNDGQWFDPAAPITVTFQQPSYNVNPINGLGTIRLDNSGQIVNMIKVVPPDPSLISSPQNFNDEFISYAIVIRYISGTSGFIATDDPGNFGRGIGSTADGNLQTISYNAFTPASPAIPIPTSPSIIIASISEDNWIVSVNGEQSTLSLIQAKAPDNLRGLNIGCWNAENAVSVVFDLGETLAYKSFLSSAQIVEVEGYLAQKWGLTDALVAGHKYKS